MNQSTVAHTEIGLRLTICSEYLRNEEKPVEELYGNWMRKMGGRLIEFAEFEYWYRRFKNNQFDLGFDTSQVENAVFGIPNSIQIVNDNKSETSNVDIILNSKEIFEIQNTVDREANGVEDNSAVIIEKEKPVKIVKGNMQDLKLNYQFNEKDVPQTFQTAIFRLSKGMLALSNHITVHFNEQNCTSQCTISVGKDIIHWKKRGNGWIIRYPRNKTVFTTHDPEKSIIDHLWILLRIFKIELGYFKIINDETSVSNLNNQNCHHLDSEKINTHLQAMIDSIDYQIEPSRLEMKGFNEDSFLSILRHVKPGVLKRIDFDISWKEEGNYQKMNEIVETDQWKQAKRIESPGVTPLKVDDLFQCEHFELQLDHITPEDVLRITNHFFHSAGKKNCTLNKGLSHKNEPLDIDAIIDFLRSQNDGAEISDNFSLFSDSYSHFIIKSTKCIALVGYQNSITIHTSSGFSNE